MNILWLSWKDSEHPQSGGAETISKEITKRLVSDGHEVLMISAGFHGAKSDILKDGVRIIRLGSRLTLYLKTWQFYKKFLNGWPDLVIDECNTIPFYASFYASEPVVMLVHQLAREIWFYQMIWPISWLGYLLEPFYLRVLNGTRVVTVSKSTKNDLMKYGYQENRISIISEGIDLEPMVDISKNEKFKETTLIFLGAIRPMKQPNHVIKAFEIAKKKEKGLRLFIVGQGEGRYFKKLMKQIKDSPYTKDIKYFGRVTQKTKKELLSKAHILLVSSIKEGWGLVVTEAGSQGTPSISYDTSGLRDSVQNQKTGLLTKSNTPKHLAETIIYLIQDPTKYTNLRKNAWELSKSITFDQSYKDFYRVIKRFESKK
jgi:glycosyltransferase involved in cell wall biosynthesis